jgi:hypothetical protein
MCHDCRRFTPKLVYLLQGNNGYAAFDGDESTGVYSVCHGRCRVSIVNKDYENELTSLRTFIIRLGLVFFFTPRSSHGPAMELVLSISECTHSSFARCADIDHLTAVPLSAVLVFGTQRDLVRLWKAGFEACFNWISPPKTQLRASPDASGSFLRPCSNSSEDTVLNIAITEIPLAVEPTWRSHAAPGSRFFRFS